MGFNVVMMGPPGAGKGTQAVLLAQELGATHFSTGDLLRKEIAAGSPIGIKTRSYMDSGVLVPDRVMAELVASHVLRAARGEGFILDGYPRTVEQAQDMQTHFAKNGVALSAVVNIQLSDDAIVERLVHRLSCSKCPRSYHTKANPPKVAGVCDGCQATLTRRKDDTEEVIRHRVRVYWEQTAPVVEYYRSRGLLRNVDGSQPIGSLASMLREALAPRVIARSATA